MSISKGICEIDFHDDFIFYKAHSICPCDDCSQELSLSYDKDIDSVVLEVGANFQTDDLYKYEWKNSNLIRRIFCKLSNRIKVSFKMLFTGTIQLHHYFMFKDDNIGDYIKALQEGLLKMEEYKKLIKV